jgi:NhaP-type Na+/H+ or K+/H+ antiporter
MEKQSRNRIGDDLVLLLGVVFEALLILRLHAWSLSSGHSNVKEWRIKLLIHAGAPNGTVVLLYAAFLRVECGMR